MVSFFSKRLNEVLSYESTSVNLFWSGGDKRDRTADLLNAIQALSQLSYTPISSKKVVGQNGLALLRQSHAGWNSPPDCF